MRLSTLLLISTFFWACAGDSAPVFTDVNTAIDRADSAKSAGDVTATSRTNPVRPVVSGVAY